IQPGSGDSLQFMKAGVMELPDVVVVTKADTGAMATRAKADVEGALSLVTLDLDAWRAPVVLVSALEGTGFADLDLALEAHGSWLADGRLAGRRSTQEALWVEETIRARFGRAGVQAGAGHGGSGGPFTQADRIAAMLAARLGETANLRR
ncbi:MAG: methylmalonyl Co-A mutase-associated GTPase MeaB, partial [Alphaproteobacteria bacterium]